MDVWKIAEKPLTFGTIETWLVQGSIVLFSWEVI